MSRSRAPRRRRRFAQARNGHPDPAMPPAAILDIDGTLVDSNYQHALAWHRALRLHGVTVPMWRCHRAIGMGGDQLVAHLAGDGFDEARGDEVRLAEHALFQQMIAEVRPFHGARAALEALRARGCSVVLASSAKPGDLTRYLELLDAGELVDGWTDSSSVERTKPAPNLVAAALEIAGDGPAVMVGDSTWDVVAASKLELPTICVRTGGFGADELREAGAIAVFDSIAELCERLSETPFR